MSQLPDFEKQKQLQYNRANLQRAYDAVMSEGMSVYKASRVFNVPTQTLRDRVNGKVALDSKVGHDTIFTYEEEEALVHHIKYMAEIGYGYTRTSIQRMAREYATSLHKPSQTKQQGTVQLSNNWFYGFLDRWSDLKLAKPQKLSLARAQNASQEKIKNYFKELSTIITKNDLSEKPHRIYNIDETGIATDHSPPKIVCAKGANPQSVTSNRSSTVTIIAGGNAVGNFIPPFYVFPGKRWNPDLLSGALPGSSGQMSESGWSNGAIFENYITTHFAINAGITEQANQVPLLILFDGHRSHISLTLTNWAKQRNVILFVLPPHSSHLTQPLDVGVFGPLKNIYNRECAVYLQTHPGCSITKYDIAALTSRPYLKAMCPENLISAFKKTGVFPVNSKAITTEQTAPSTIYAAKVNSTPGKEPDVNKPATCQENDHNSATTSEVHQIDNSLLEEQSNFLNKQPENVQQPADNRPASFFNARTITSVPEKKTKRKFVPPYLAGNLSKKSNMEILESTNSKKPKPEITSTIKPTKSKNKPVTASNKVTKETHSGKKSTSTEVFDDQRPSTSGLNTKGGPISLMESSEELSQSDFTDDEEMCCVCDKWQPSERKGIPGCIFVQWAKCDFCPHWTHLRYCTEVTVLRRNSVFRCPHCTEK